jgi:pre-rRNA-processing protein TSR4
MQLVPLHLDVDSELHSALDFGTIAVYTCGASCELSGGVSGGVDVSGVSAAYAEEVVLVHPPLNA